MFVPPTAEALLQARKHLAAADPALAAMEAVTPPFAWRVGLGGFPGLLKMVVQQQVSLASAAAIWARVEAGLPQMTPEAVMGHDEAYLLSLGLSRPKARDAHAIAHAHLNGTCDIDALPGLPDGARRTGLGPLGEPPDRRSLVWIRKRAVRVDRLTW